MLSPQFNFPPESYSAVFTVSGDVANANVNKVSDIETRAASPDSILQQPSASLLNCFDCAFRNSVKILRKEKKPRKPKNNAGSYAYVDCR
ncbi:hypothetical protein KGM_213801 [Danaus plexippus plexippus]|uniref:Uncharacterized protein n=1 Tax=Danaus plexippus plexippus TaxID=278856 RepID=A0A212EUR0_DANPL|nr:hypothetical protein KGM_213801 [Danaus plexippus plexippus]